LRRSIVASILLCVMVCGAEGLMAAEATMPLSIRSESFEPGEAMPREHTCEGEDVSPQLTWTGIPDGTESMALIMDDPDAPDPEHPRMTWVHWVLYDLPVTTSGLPRGISPDELPAGTRQGLNDWNRTGYGGPCPPIGRHRYFHKLYALDTLLGDLGTPTKAELEAAMDGHVLARAEIVGTYRTGE
jgi:Raf kinase inhibitor-like YbhB/YbcL family protein